MPQRRGLSGAPIDLITGDWLSGTPNADAAEAPEAVMAAQEFARNLKTAIGTRSKRSVAERAGISHPTVLNLLTGASWPDFVSVVRLEVALEVPLWPMGHLRG